MTTITFLQYPITLPQNFHSVTIFNVRFLISTSLNRETNIHGRIIFTIIDSAVISLFNTWFNSGVHGREGEAILYSDENGINHKFRFALVSLDQNTGETEGIYTFIE